MECQNHADYKESMTWLLDAVDEYARHARTVGQHGKEAHGTVTSNSALRQSIREIRTLLERFANGQSMDGMLDAANVLIDDANRDPELRQWFHDVDAYIRKVSALSLNIRCWTHPVMLFRCFWRPDTLSSQVAEPELVNYASRVEDSMTTSIRATSTTCSAASAGGLKRWVKTLLIRSSAMTGPSSPNTCSSMLTVP